MIRPFRPGRAGGLLAGALVAAFTAPSALALQAGQEAFPHQLHEGLFPVCQGCHGGIEEDDEATFHPDPERCVACHDGVRAPEVAWAGPTRRPSNLDFSHRSHRERLAAEGESAACADCHGPPGAEGRMDVRPASPERCVACHGHERLDHPDGGQPCTLCHRPLAEASGLDAARIESFPRPASHARDGFLSTHGPDVTTAETLCATCHARPSCERCHANAVDLEPVRALAPDPRVEALVADRSPEYPTPEDHRAPAWLRAHGAAAAQGVEACANCHTRPSCLTCHGEATGAVAALPAPVPAGATGVVLDAAEARSRLHPPGFDLGHGSEAAIGGSACESCHAESFCTDCHAGPSTPSFHPPPFVETHGPRAWGAGADCSSCHSTELFCRSCHAGAGLTSSGPLDAGFHDAQPFWLLGHGQAARQSLEGCVTCHAQPDCARCHSPLGGWGVNPHGSGFDASRYRERARAGCVLCHRGGVPP